MVDRRLNENTSSIEEMPFRDRSGPETEESLKKKIEYHGAIGQLLACGNFVWSLGQICLLIIHYAIECNLSFGDFPGFSVLFGVVENPKNHIHGFQAFILIIPFIIYQIMQIILAEALLSGIHEADERRMQLFIMAYGLAFGLEMIANIYGLILMPTEFMFLVAVLIFVFFKCYTMIIAKRMKFLFDALFEILVAKIDNMGQNHETNVVDLDNAIELA